MKARLLNHGGYFGLPSKYPIEIEASISGDRFMDVTAEELIRVGADPDQVNGEPFPFITGREIELIEEVGNES